MPHEYTKVGKGFLMAVDAKKNPKGPDYTGKIELEDGREIQLSGWIEVAKSSGKKYLSIALEEARELEPERPARGSQPPSNWDSGDDVPF
jgi:hypothetical protein